MVFTEQEIDYLESQQLGRLATVQPNGTLQVSPVGFAYNTVTQTIDVVGYNMAASRKFLNIADNGRVAFVVDDIASTDPWRVRCIEMRGTADAIAADVNSVSLIRIRPDRVISFGLDDIDIDPHDLVPSRRNVVR